MLAALAPSGSADADVLEARRNAAAAHLAESVAALEGIRLDLLRLHAGASDLAPLTTLIDAARLLGEDVQPARRRAARSGRRYGASVPALTQRDGEHPGSAFGSLGSDSLF